MPGKAPRQKGDRAERDLVKRLQAAGLPARRVPLSGSVKGYPGDVSATVGGREVTLEVKSRKNFATLHAWLDERDALVLKADRSEPLLVVRLNTLLELLGKPEAEGVN
jgi:Holliday junction resolvase